MLTKHCYLNYCNVCTYMMATQHTTYRVLVAYWQFYIVQSWVTVLYMHVDTHLLGPHPFRLYSAVGFYARVCFGRHCIIQNKFSQRNKFALFQTLHMKWDFINIFYITLFQICVKYDCTVNWKKKIYCIVLGVCILWKHVTLILFSLKQGSFTIFGIVWFVRTCLHSVFDTTIWKSHSQYLLLKLNVQFHYMKFFTIGEYKATIKVTNLKFLVCTLTG